MSKKSLNQIALESDRLEEERQEEVRLEEQRRAEVEEPVTHEPDLNDMEGDLDEGDAEFDTEQSEAFAIESLQVYRDTLEHQIKSKTVTMESIALIQMGVQNVYASQGVRMRTVAQESNLSAEAYGQIVLESIFGAVGNAAVLPFKRWKDRLTDLFRSTESMAMKYREKLTSARQELQAKKFAGAAEVNMHELWGFFSTGEGQAVRVVETLGKDLAMSKYVLVEYPQQLLKLIQSITSAVGSADFRTPEGAKRAFLAVEKLPHPTEVFNKQFISGEKKPYLGVTGLDVQVGAKRKVLALQGQAFPKLAELASAKRINEVSSFSHNAANLAGKIGGKVVGNAVNAASMVLSKNTKLTFQDVEKIIAYGEEYVNNVEAFKKIEPQLVQAMEHLDSALEKFMDGKLDKEVHGLFVQLCHYVDGVMNAVSNPAGREVHRALRGARFVAYMARRAIFHRSAKGEGDQQQAPAGEPAAA
jgi:hypothetical protein